MIDTSPAACRLTAEVLFQISTSKNCTENDRPIIHAAAERLAVIAHEADQRAAQTEEPPVEPEPPPWDTPKHRARRQLIASDPHELAVALARFVITVSAVAQDVSTLYTAAIATGDFTKAMQEHVLYTSRLMQEQFLAEFGRPILP